VSEFDHLGERLLVIYDGVCGFCNLSVRWFLRRDRHDRLRFVPSDSPKVAELLTRHGISQSDQGLASSALAPSTILVVRHPQAPDEEVLVRSDAALAMLAALPRPWPAVAAVLSWIPRPIRDLGYRLIAHYRYRIWGRLESCPIPTATERARFL